MIKHLRGLGLAIIGAGALSASVAAQTAPPIPPASIPGQPAAVHCAAPSASDQPASNPACVRLEGQLAILNRGGADPARADQIKTLRGLGRQAAVGSRPHAGAIEKARLRRRRIFFAVHRQSPECQPLKRANSADARQPRPHDERSRASQKAATTTIRTANAAS